MRIPGLVSILLLVLFAAFAGHGWAAPSSSATAIPSLHAPALSVKPVLGQHLRLQHLSADVRYRQGRSAVAGTSRTVSLTVTVGYDDQYRGLGSCPRQSSESYQRHDKRHGRDSRCADRLRSRSSCSIQDGIRRSGGTSSRSRQTCDSFHPCGWCRQPSCSALYLRRQNPRDAQRLPHDIWRFRLHARYLNARPSVGDLAQACELGANDGRYRVSYTLHR